MISSLLHLVGLRSRVYYTLTNFRGGGGKAPLPPPPQYANGLSEWILGAHLLKQAFAIGGFGGMLPRENCFEWCNLVRFGAYFHKIFTLKKSKDIHYL